MNLFVFYIPLSSYKTNVTTLSPNRNSPFYIPLSSYKTGDAVAVFKSGKSFTFHLVHIKPRNFAYVSGV